MENIAIRVMLGEQIDIDFKRNTRKRSVDLNNYEYTNWIVYKDIVDRDNLERFI